MPSASATIPRSTTILTSVSNIESRSADAWSIPRINPISNLMTVGSHLDELGQPVLPGEVVVRQLHVQIGKRHPARRCILDPSVAADS